MPYCTAWETVCEFWWTSVANSSDKFAVGCFVKGRCGKCNGKMQTNLQYEMVSKTDDSSLTAYLEWRLNTAGWLHKKAREDCLCLFIQSVRRSCQDIHTDGYDMVPEIPRYDHVKATLCTERRKGLGTEYNQQKWVPGVFTGGKGGRCVRLTILPPSCAVVTKAGSLNFLEPPGSVQAC